MPTLTQLPSGKWRAQVRKAGIYRAATFASKREAKDWATVIESQATHVAAGGLAPLPKGATFGDLIDKYLEVTKAKFGKTKTATLAMLKRELGDIRMTKFNALTLRDFIDRRKEQGAGGVTISADLSYCTTILKWARNSRKYEVNDKLGLDARKSLTYDTDLKTRADERSREPSAKELAKLYEYWQTNKRQKIPMVTLCEFALATGMRQGEITRLDIADLDREQRTIIIRDRKDPRNKQGNHQRVPLLPKAWAIVEPLIQDREDGFLFPFAESSVSTAFTRACAKLDIEDLHFHDLRHAATASFFRMGLQIPQVALLTGHKTWTMLRRYTDVKPEDVLAALQKTASPAPSNAGQQGDSRGDSTTPTV